MVGRAALHVEGGAQVPKGPSVKEPSKGFSFEDTTLKAQPEVKTVSLTRDEAEKKIHNFSIANILDKTEKEFRKAYRSLSIPIKSLSNEQVELLHLLTQKNIADPTQQKQIIADLKRLFPEKQLEVSEMIRQIGLKVKRLAEDSDDEEPAAWTRAKIAVPNNRASIGVPLPPQHIQLDVANESAVPPQPLPEWAKPAKLKDLNGEDLYKHLNEFPEDKEAVKELSKMSPGDILSLMQNLEKLHDEKLPPGWFKGIRRWWSSVGKPGELHKAIENQKRILDLITSPPLDQDQLQSALDAGKAPRETATGTTGSFYVKNFRGEVGGVFKLMSQEPGAIGNERMEAKGGINVSFRSSIQPGQGAGNEVVAYALDQALNGRYGIPRTQLVELKHVSLKSSKSELGSVQEFLPGMKPLNAADSGPFLESIPRTEFDRFNFKLISGGTDGHYGNFLYNSTSKKLGLIDAGLDFVGQADFQHMNQQYWTNLPQAEQLMSPEEYAALKNINTDNAMASVDVQVKSNVARSPILAMSNDKMLALKMRLELAKIAGEEGLTQKQWFDILAPPKYSNEPHYAQIFTRFIKPELTDGEWKADDQKIDWEQIRQELRKAAKQQKTGK